MAWQARRGGFWSGGAGLGLFWQGRRGMVWLGAVRSVVVLSGEVGQARFGRLCSGEFGYGDVWQGVAIYFISLGGKKIERYLFMESGQPL
jgi:hypothetical protein